jgi:hypothetical protein
MAQCGWVPVAVVSSASVVAGRGPRRRAVAIGRAACPKGCTTDSDQGPARRIRVGRRGTGGGSVHVRTQGAGTVGGTGIEQAVTLPRVTEVRVRNSGTTDPAKSCRVCPSALGVGAGGDSEV